MRRPVRPELARRFAAKLSEHDKLRRDHRAAHRTIDEVVTMRDDLDQRLRHELASGAELKAKLNRPQEA